MKDNEKTSLNFDQEKDFLELDFEKLENVSGGRAIR